MNYNELLESVCEYINKTLLDAAARVTHTCKNNSVKMSGILITKEGVNAAPTIYMENYYLDYLKGMDVSEIGDKVIAVYRETSLSENIDMGFFNDYEQVREHLFIKVVNLEKNRELLQEVPYEEYLDLAITVYCKVKNKLVGNGSILIKNSHLSLWNVDAKKVLEDALENSKNREKMKVRHIFEMLRSIGPCCVKSIPLCEEDLSMYVVTTNDGYYGALYMALPSRLKEMSEIIGGNFYIIPSSVHELIIISSECGDFDSLSTMIREVNETAVGREEVLADHPYYYNASEEKLYMTAVG